MIQPELKYEWIGVLTCWFNPSWKWDQLYLINVAYDVTVDA